MITMIVIQIYINAEIADNLQNINIIFNHNFAKGKSLPAPSPVTGIKINLPENWSK